MMNNDKKVAEQLVLIQILDKLRYLEEGMKVIKNDLDTLTKVVQKEKDKTPQSSKPSYSNRNIEVLDTENFYLCVVCQGRPDFVHKLIARTCSVECSTIVETTLFNLDKKKK